VDFKPELGFGGKAHITSRVPSLCTNNESVEHMVGKIQFQLFLITKLIKKNNVWWGSTSKGIEFVISISRVQVLHRASSHTSRDLRNTQDKCFHLWNEVKNKFNGRRLLKRLL
jgi:nitrous oxidase accessory protein NosD